VNRSVYRRLPAACIAICLLTAGREAAPDPPPTSINAEAAWAALVRLDSESVVMASRQGEPSDPESRLALALAWLNLQPRTPGNRQKAINLLEGLRHPENDEPIRAAAAYYRVRADSRFQREPDTRAVAAAYEAVASEFAGQFFGEFALVKAMTLDLTVNLEGRDPIVVARAWYPRIDPIVSPALRRGGLVILATTLILHEEDPTAASAWLDQSGFRDFRRWDFRWRSHLRAIHLALTLDRRQEAQDLAAEFRRLYPRSPYLELLDGLVSGQIPLP
jgi:hypothetical protein